MDKKAPSPRESQEPTPPATNWWDKDLEEWRDSPYVRPIIIAALVVSGMCAVMLFFFFIIFPIWFPYFAPFQFLLGVILYLVARKFISGKKRLLAFMVIVCVLSFEGMYIVATGPYPETWEGAVEFYRAVLIVASLGGIPYLAYRYRSILQRAVLSYTSRGTSPNEAHSSEVESITLTKKTKTTKALLIVLWVSIITCGLIVLSILLSVFPPGFIPLWAFILLFILGVVAQYRKMKEGQDQRLTVRDVWLREKRYERLLKRLKHPLTLPSWPGFFTRDNTRDRSRRRSDAYPIFGAVYAVIQKLIIPLLYGFTLSVFSYEMWLEFFKPEWAAIINLVAGGGFAWFIYSETILYVTFLAEGVEGRMAPEGPDQGRQRPTLGGLIRYAMSLGLVTANAAFFGYWMYESFLQWDRGSPLVYHVFIRYAAGYLTAFVVYTTFREAFIHAWRARYLVTQMLQWFVLGTVPLIIAAGVRQFLSSSTPLIPPLIAGISILFGVFGYVAVAHVIQLQWPSHTHKRGREESTYEKAKKAADSINKADDLPGIFMGGLEVPWKDRTSHFSYTGTTGSGKSTQIRLMQQDVLPYVGKDVDQRALIYDAKLEGYSQLEGVNLDTTYPITLNPFDKRSPGLNLSKDITNPALALQIATILFYDRPGSNEFFTSTARRVGAGVLEAFILRKLHGEIAEWTFSDWCRVMTDPDHINHVLNNTPQTRKILKSLRHEETLNNVMSTIASYMTHYEIIGALWDRKDEEREDTREAAVSIKDWATDKRGSILIMSRTDEATEAVDAINAVTFSLAAQYALALPNSTQRSTWFFLDEMAEGKKFPYLTKLALKGRSKGCCIVLGFQDIDGVRLTYGEKEGNQIIAMCSYRWFGKIDSDVTQVWAGNQLGTKEIEEPTKSIQNDKGNQKTSTQYQKKIVPVVIPSDFGTFPKADFTVNGIKGWYVMPNPIGAFEHTIPPKLLTERIPPPATPNTPDAPVDFDPITDPMAQYLDDWTEEQRDYYLGATRKLIPEETPKEKEATPLNDLKIKTSEKESINVPPEDVYWSKGMLEEKVINGKVINGVDPTPTPPRPRPKKKPKLTL